MSIEQPVVDIAARYLPTLDKETIAAAVDRLEQIPPSLTLADSVKKEKDCNCYNEEQC